MPTDSLIDLLPIEFWIAVAVMVSLAIYAVSQIRHGIGLPLLAVLATVAVWYIGDVAYNNYANNHLIKFPPEVLAFAWIQVVVFSATLFAGVLAIQPIANRDCYQNASRIHFLSQHGSDFLEIQETVSLFGKICWGLWIGLIALAILNVGSDSFSFALPFTGHPINPFVRGRVASGPLGAVFSLATNFHVLVAAGFGLVAALSKNPLIRIAAIVGCFMTWPYFLLNRTRNTMLATCAPGIFAWIFVRVRLSFSLKIVLLLAALFIGDTWLRFVMEARNNQTSVAGYFLNSDVQEITSTDTKHAGLNMYEELCWLNHLMENGNYTPNGGRRYFAEAVNPVPRALWSGKPLIGIEYAIARGQKFDQAGAAQAGVGATISTGMIGQGVDNFGPIFGPIAAGLLMSFWVVILARIDLHAASTWRLPLYALGLVLTFNCGRDITLLVLYPFVFGLLIVKFLETQKPNQPEQYAVAR